MRSTAGPLVGLIASLYATPSRPASRTRPGSRRLRERQAERAGRHPSASNAHQATALTPAAVDAEPGVRARARYVIGDPGDGRVRLWRGGSVAQLLEQVQWQRQWLPRTRLYFNLAEFVSRPPRGPVSPPVAASPSERGAGRAAHGHRVEGGGRWRSRRRRATRDSGSSVSIPRYNKVRLISPAPSTCPGPRPPRPHEAGGRPALLPGRDRPPGPRAARAPGGRFKLVATVEAGGIEPRPNVPIKGSPRVSRPRSLVAC